MSRKVPILPDLERESLAVRARMAETLVEVAVRAGGAIAAVLLSAAAITRRVDIFAFGSLVAMLAGIGAFQKVREKPEPRLWLGVASTGCVLVVPFIDRAVQLVILPSLTMLIVIGVLTLPKKWSRWFAVWNGILMVVSLAWLLPDPTVMEAMLAVLLLTGAGWVAWRVVNAASDNMIREQDSDRKLFDSSPVATLEEDYSGVRQSSITSTRRVSPTWRAICGIDLMRCAE